MNLAQGLPLGTTLAVAGNVTGTLTLGGPLAGTISVGGAVASGAAVQLSSVASTGRLRVAGALAAPVTVTNALAGLVLVNTGNTGAVWTGNVQASGVTLNPRPFYDETPALLGGGGVALAPFNLHKAASSPPNTLDAPIGFRHEGSFRSTDPATFQPVTVWHYGPIARADASQPAVEIRRLPLNVSSDFAAAPVVTSEFIVSYGAEGDAALADPLGRVIHLRPGATFAGGPFKYRVSPTANLRSVTGPSATAPVADYAYLFFNGCAHGGGNPNPADIVSIGGFPPPDANSPSTTTPPSSTPSPGRTFWPTSSPSAVSRRPMVK